MKNLGYVYFCGWDYQVNPPAGIANLTNLEHDDPWHQLCCVLERAKLGDFSFLDRLVGLCRSTDINLRFAAEYLLAAAAPSTHLEVLSSQILDLDSGWRMESADHACLSGALGFVDTFIKGYRIAFGETTRAAMEDGLSNLLVTDPESRFVVDRLMMTSDKEQGEAQLRERAREQVDKFGPKVSFRNGVPLTIEAIVADIDRTLSEGNYDESFAELQALMTQLQTMVGFSQVGMFTEGDDEASNGWVETLIREQLDNALTLNFRPGVRYFFGYPAPL